MKKNKTIFIVVVLLILGLVAFRLINNKRHIESKKQVKKNNGVYAAVNVATVEEKISELNLIMVGTVTANQEIDVKSEVPGKIVSMFFSLGDYVNKGKVLAKIDDRIRELSSQTAQQKLADAKQNLERYKNLFEGGAASKAQLDQYQLAFNNAKIQVDQAGKELSNTAASAPITGYITTKSVEAGSYVNIGSSIATIVDISKLKILLSVAERDVYSLKVEDNVTITSSVYPGTNFKGVINFISFKGDAAHNYPIEISIENKQKNPLKAGTYVDVAFNKKNILPSLQIPREALVGSIKDAKVYKVNSNNLVNLTPITISGETENNIIVSEGLSKGDNVVTSGQINLSDGSKVSIIK